MHTFYIILFIYAISYMICKPIVDWLARNAQKVINAINSDPIYNYAFFCIPFIPIVNTYIILIYLKKFILCGFSVERLKDRINKK